MNHQRENRTVSYTNASKKKRNKFNQGAETPVQSWAPSHRVWVQVPPYPLTCRVTQGKSHNNLRLNIFNCKMDTNPVSLSRAVNLQENAYLGPGVGVYPGPSLIWNSSRTGLSSSGGWGSSVEPGSQMGLDKDEDKKNTGQKKILVLCQGGEPPPFQISE